MGEQHRSFWAALAELADTEGLTHALDLSDNRADWWPAGMTWRQTFGRFEPEGHAYATLALQTTTEPAVIALVKAHRQVPAETPPGTWIHELPLVGFLHVRAFPHDPRLSTLAAVVEGSQQVRVVRYRPEKRCTLRIGAGDATQWAKVFSDGTGESIHRSQETLWEASRRGELDAAVAAPIRYDAATRAVWVGHVPGNVITGRLFGSAGPVLAQRLGVAAGSVTQIAATPQARSDGAAQLERSRRNAATIARYLPEVTTPLRAVLLGLQRLHAAAMPRPRPIHGAPHPEQWLDDDGRLGLIDFDRFSLGDPELDITTFQAEVDFESVPASLRNDINAAFRAGYESRAGAMDLSLLLAYRVHKRLAKVLRAARAIRPDGDVRAASHLERVTELLRGAPS